VLRALVSRIVAWWRRLRARALDNVRALPPRVIDRYAGACNSHVYAGTDEREYCLGRMVCELEWRATLSPEEGERVWQRARSSVGESVVAAAEAVFARRHPPPPPLPPDVLMAFDRARRQLREAQGGL
jgi:hypothetical protein